MPSKKKQNKDLGLSEQTLKYKKLRKVLNQEKYSRLDLLCVLKKLIAQGIIPDKVVEGGLNQQSKEQLVKYPPSWAIWKVKHTLDEYLKKNTVALNESGKQVFQKLDVYTSKILITELKALKIEIENMNLMKKKELILAIINKKKGKSFLKYLEENYEDENLSESD